MLPRLVIGLLVVLAGSYLALASRGRPAPDHPFFKESRPDVIAHRGGAGHSPENTLFAFARALEAGADVVEMDVRATRDGELVALHDASVDRTTDGKGPLGALAFEEVRALDAGYGWTRDGGKTHPYRGRGITVPRVEEVPPRSAARSIQPRDEGPLAPSGGRALRSRARHGDERESPRGVFPRERHGRVLGACPGVATSATPAEARRLVTLSFVFLGGLYQPAAEALQVPERMGRWTVVTPRVVRQAQRLNLRVQV